MITVITTDDQRFTQLIKDFQEVDLYRTPSSKPFPNDLFTTVDGEVPKSSIKGTFLVQIVSIEPFNQMNINQNEMNGDFPLLLTVTDGMTDVNALTNGSINHLNVHCKCGSKLLLTDTIPIQDGYLQLNCDNTQFHFGSNTYPRPRSAYRGRTSGSSRPTYEGRRNHRYDNDDGGETNFSKRPTTTLMDFMPQLKISTDSSENEKNKERNDKRRSHVDTSQSTMKLKGSKDQIVVEQDGMEEFIDNDDDPSHGIFRERRNPLPPRLQRVQEERSRRNPTRFPDDSSILMGNDLTNVYHQDPSSTYLQRADPMSYSATIPSFVPHGNLLTSNNPHLTYYSTNPNPLTFNLSAMANPSYSMASGYPLNEQRNFCYAPTYSIPNYVSMTNEIDGDDNEKKEEIQSLGQSDENNEHFNPSITAEQTEEKRRDGYSNPRPRWKVGDTCLARWSEDGEFYYATVIQIQVPFCNVIFFEYNTYDKVHFNDMKMISRDLQYYQYVPPSSDYNVFNGNAFYPPSRGEIYSSHIDGNVSMPVVPPFPFSSDGTLYMCPSSSIARGIRSHRRNDLESQPCSIADAPLLLVTTDGHPSPKENEKEEEEEEEKSMVRE